MPAPYSDNLYSDPDPVRDDANANEDAEADALSPSDGYFHASSPQDSSPLSPTSHRRSQSGSVPFVPNVLVEDPTLQQAQGSSNKAQEAEQERLINSSGGATPTSPTAQSHSSPTTSHYPSVTHYSHNPLRSPTVVSSTVSYTPAPSSSGRSTASPAHHHRRSVDEDHSPYHPSQSQHPSSSSSCPAGHTSGVVHNASNPNDAPPAYTPTSPTSTGYQTFPSAAPSNTDNMGVPEENQSLLPRQPQSMGDNPQGIPPPMWQRLKEAPRSSKFRSRLKTVLGILVIFSILFALFGGITISRTTFPKPPHFDKHPIRKPDMGDNDLTWNPNPGCLDTPQSVYSSVYNPSFNLGDSLTLEQKIGHRRDGLRNGRSPRVSGDVIVRPTDSNKGKINVEIITNHQNVDFDVSYTSGHHQKLRIETANDIPWTEAKSPCIQIRVTLWVPQEASLNALNIDTTQLDITVADGLSLAVGSGLAFSTISGNVLLPDHTPNSKEVPYKLASREISIKTISGDVQGWFPLYDLLKVETTSGDIIIDHAPQPAESDNGGSARYVIKSVSGDLKLKQSLRPDPSSNKINIPQRAYTINVETTSGNIATDLVIGESTDIQTISGSLKLDLLPVVPADADSGNFYFRTESMSGTLRLNIADPIEFDADNLKHYKPSDLKHLRSEHKAVSGNMKIKYPVSWEGKLTGKAISTSWNIHGKGVQVTRRGGFMNKEVLATKGNGDSTITIGEMSGNVDVLLGED